MIPFSGHSFTAALSRESPIHGLPNTTLSGLWALMQFDKSIFAVIGTGLHSHECLCGGEVPYQSTSVDGHHVLLMRAAQTAIVCEGR